MAEVRSSLADSEEPEEPTEEIPEDVDPFAIASAADLQRNSLDVIGLSKCPRCGQRSRVSVGLLKAGLCFFLPLTVASAFTAWVFAPSLFMLISVATFSLGMAKMAHYARLWNAQRRVSFRETNQTLQVSRSLPKAQARLQPPPARVLPEPIPVEPRPSHAGRAPTVNDAGPSILK